MYQIGGCEEATNLVWRLLRQWLESRPPWSVGACSLANLPNKSTCHNNAQCLSTHHDLNGQQRPPWCPTPGTAAGNSCPENWLIVVCGGARSEAPWYGGKMASMMDTCSKPVCLTSWKKRSRDLSLSDHGFMQWACLFCQYGGRMASASSEPVCLTCPTGRIDLKISLSLRLKFPLNDVRTISSHKAQQEIQLGVFTGSFSYLSATTRFFVMTVSLNHMQVSLLSLSNHTFLSMTISINHTFLPNDKSLRDDSNNKPANALKQAKYPDVCFHNFHS